MDVTEHLCMGDTAIEDANHDPQTTVEMSVQELVAAVHCVLLSQAMRRFLPRGYVRGLTLIVGELSVRAQMHDDEAWSDEWKAEHPRRFGSS